MEGYIGGIALPTNVTLGKCIPSMLCVVDVYLTTFSQQCSNVLLFGIIRLRLSQERIKNCLCILFTDNSFVSIFRFKNNSKIFNGLSLYSLLNSDWVCCWYCYFTRYDIPFQHNVERKIINGSIQKIMKLVVGDGESHLYARFLSHQMRGPFRNFII